MCVVCVRERECVAGFSGFVGTFLGFPCLLNAASANNEL